MRWSKINPRLIAQITIFVVLAYVVAHYDEILPYKWETYQSPEGRFAAKFPATPVVSSESTEGPAANVLAHTVSATPNRETAFAVAWSDVERSGRSDDELLDDVRDGALKHVHGNLIEEKRMRVQGHPARELRVEVRGEALLICRMILIENRLYQLIFSSRRLREDRRSVQKFFDSFRAM